MLGEGNLLYYFNQKIVLKTILLIILIGYGSSYAWIYPEHRDITLLGVQKLDRENRSQLDKLWSEARTGFENRLTESIIDSAQTTDLTQLDWAAWPAMSGLSVIAPSRRSSASPVRPCRARMRAAR